MRHTKTVLKKISLNCCYSNDLAFIYLSDIVHERKLKGGVMIIRKLQRLIFFLLLIYPFQPGLGDFHPTACLAASEEGFKLSRRDKALGIHFIDERTGWVVGDNGLALMTADGGEIWQRLKISEESLNDVFFVRDKGWITGSGGMILHTPDGGKNWENQNSNVNVSLMRIIFLDKDKGFSIGADGTIIRTVDGGLNWQIVDFDWMGHMPEELLARGIISINLYDIFFLNEISGWIVGDWGTILNTVDNGKEWKLSHIGSFPSLYSLSFKNDKQGWAVGQNGFSLKTEDGGGNWEKVVIEEKNSLYRIRISNGYGVIVGDQGTMLKTNDGGETWSKVETGLHPPYPWLTDAWILPFNSAKILSIGKGIILRSRITLKK